jgi:dienelactone hydrolase
MTGGVCARAAAALLLVLSLTAPCGSDAADLSVYGKLPAIEDVILSGDGSRLAYLRTQGDERVVSVYATDGHRLLRTVGVGHQKIRWIEWADADHLLITESYTLEWPGFGAWREQYQTWVFDLRDGSFQLIPRAPGRNFALSPIVLGRPDIRRVAGHTVLFLRSVQVMEVEHEVLVRIDLRTGDTRVIESPQAGLYRHWLVDAAGSVAVEQSYNPQSRHWRILSYRDGRTKELASGQDRIEYPHVVGWGPEPETVLLQKPEADGGSFWRLLSLKDGTIGSPLSEHQDFEEPIEDPISHRMIGGTHTENYKEVTFFDTVTRYSWEMVLSTFPGERVELASHSDDFRKFVVRVESRDKGYRFVLIDLDAHYMSPLGEIYEGVKPYEVRRIDYMAADGTEIPAYLTLPDRPARNLPLVVLPHGGPMARDTAGFDWWSQGLASLGYAVLRPNYRGSDLDWPFVSKGFGEWGRKMQTDLSDGVRYLAKEGTVDPKRVCIVGGSYGGYAALAGPSLDPGVYRCAVSVAGIADLRLWLNDVGGNQARSRVQSYWDRYMGVKGPADPLLDTISPIKHIDAITVPILLIHGRDDTVVEYRQSEAMYDALRRAQKDVQLVALTHEDHWLSRPEMRLQMLEATATFLLKNNPPN